MTNYLKTIVSVVGALLAIVHAVLIQDPTLPIDWQLLVNAVVAPFLVWLVPNVKPDPVAIVPPVAPAASTEHAEVLVTANAVAPMDPA